MRAPALAACAALALGSFACGSNISGTYTGTATGTFNGQTAGSVSMTIYQSGTAVTGNYSLVMNNNSVSSAGTVTGTVSGTDIGNLTLGQVQSSACGYTGSLTGTAKVNTGFLGATMAGTLGSCAGVSLTLNLTKSN